jgi:hypothetical protein
MCAGVCAFNVCVCLSVRVTKRGHTLLFLVSVCSLPHKHKHPHSGMNKHRNEKDRQVQRRRQNRFSTKKYVPFCRGRRWRSQNRLSIDKIYESKKLHSLKKFITCIRSSMLITCTCINILVICIFMRERTACRKAQWYWPHTDLVQRSRHSQTGTFDRVYWPKP